jgi:hypothetical protein
MPQIALPASDISDSGWTPTPVFAQIDQRTPTDTTSVISSGKSQGDSFEVKFAPLSYPGPGTVTLSVRLKKTDSGKLPVTVRLVRGSTVIASRVIQPQQAFTTSAIVLTAAEAAGITTTRTCACASRRRRRPSRCGRWATRPAARPPA